jgi:ACS family hexuronate transporter-like MFS transporter
MSPLPPHRWRIAFIVSAAIAISYLDRQTLPVAIHAIQRDIPISNEQFSLLNTAFLLTYGLMYAIGGRLLDWLGTRTGFTLVMLFWSLACASHGLAATVAMLAVSRLMLGIGEGGGFPAATRAMTEWFPTAERSFAMGIMNAGTAIGAVAAPPLIALVLAFANWRCIFFLTGALGLAWTALWRATYYVPAEKPEPANDSAPSAKIPWLSLLAHRPTRGLILAKFLSDAAWYFYLFWLPKYLYDARGFDIKAVGAFAWIPYAASGIGCLCGGWLSSALISRNRSVNSSRKLALALSAVVMPLIILVPRVPVAWAIVIFSIAYFGQQSWSTLIMVLPADLFPESAVGSVAGLVGMGGAFGGVVFGQLVGWLLDHHFGYPLVFSLAASFHILAFLVICITIPVIRPILFPRVAQPIAL